MKVTSNIKNSDTAAAIFRHLSAKPLLCILAAFVVLSAIGMKKAPDTNKAEVNSVQGILIFTDSKPIATYTYLGTVSNSGVSMNPQYTNIRDKIISKVKSKYPEANAIIFHLNSGGRDNADAIKIQP